jgi:hypothetical protein
VDVPRAVRRTKDRGILSCVAVIISRLRYITFVAPLNGARKEIKAAFSDGLALQETEHMSSLNDFAQSLRKSPAAI